MRIAAIDIGTNSIHMVIADAAAPGAFTVVDREREVVQIGAGSFTRGRLRREAVQRAIEALTRFVQLARRLQSDRIICTATAAVREAKNGGEFLQGARVTAGIAPRVIPAEEEGRLIYLAVRAALQLDESPALILDIGGGSVQAVVGNKDQLLIATSAPLGALRLSETSLEGDPPSPKAIARLKRHIAKVAQSCIEQIRELDPVAAYGSSGSIHALAEAIHWEQTGQSIEQINGHVLETAALAKFTRRLTRMTLAERSQLHGVDTQRAEIIVPGALVLLHFLEELDADHITISDYGVREGLVTDYTRFHAREISRLSEVEDLRYRSVYALLDRFQADGPHPRHVAKLALALYDGLKTSHELPDEARDILHMAALLHDIGSVVGFDGHAEHSSYVIRNGMLRGLTAGEIDLVAMVARYHSKSCPRKRDPEFAALPKAQRRMVRWLSAMLRVAESLDRSHYQLIRSIKVERRPDVVSLRMSAQRDAKLEMWAARRRLDLLGRMLGSRKKPMRVRLALEAPAAATEHRRGNGAADARAPKSVKPELRLRTPRKGRDADYTPGVVERR
jgi:exopolyphosphatase/guanosine-5'-triphosphate,3'-diphosphate pyrophosphatase